MASQGSPRAVIALGGNAIIHSGERGDFREQFANTRCSMVPIVDLLENGYSFVLTHGNGPQVGAIMLQSEAATSVPAVPLHVADAMTCGSMGYMIEQCFRNEIKRRGVTRESVTVPAQIVVDRDDPAMSNPTKPIGPFYDKDQAETLAEQNGWVVREDAGRGYRRIVPSPYPVRVIESEAIKALLKLGYVPITGGGGGIPVYQAEDGALHGVDAVIDKDLASMKIALEVEAELLVIITGVSKVAIRFGTPDEMALDRITVSQARRYLEAGEFPAGSMGPKIQAAIDFVAARSTNRVVITDVEHLVAAVEGTDGTTIVAD